MVKIAVVGSINMDLVVTAERRPNAGETLFGKDFQTVPGGKGANQAVAAARLGAEVAMIGCVGQDVFGKEMIDNLKQNGVSIDHVEPVPHESSGTAHITIAEGDNSIICVEGANGKLTPSYVEKAASTLKAADMILIQQEIPEETVEYVAIFCKEYDKKLILNPAPARKVSDEVIAHATYITPNEHEFAILFGEENRSKMLAKYPNKLIITEGKNGVRYHNGETEVVVPSYKVDEPVDTTGAGDTFNGAFAVAIAEGKGIEEALQFANRAASLSVMKPGAQGGMPTRKEVEEMLKQ
ncbi:ribokinase [Caldibacillus thermolactis]|uniref:Ribokinase n=1 Tax=Pallidibacillus thermolactis TaxID=251051 RepID=A0ABT2WHU3_9BACI|nr:ribokinase [Pallidibacillus thermolactis]MCU9595266.1 ribokinase [Pallidibacillus thermolactis]MCU9600622.1 ribokinase [Pallidibacillus thermolactis subsp. kokeshiiformis]MED1673049.1 ribokinase [Pallidibacillus thermolactis subsp. kokeshiiformis]